MKCNTKQHLAPVRFLSTATYCINSPDEKNYCNMYTLKTNYIMYGLLRQKLSRPLDYYMY